MFCMCPVLDVLVVWIDSPFYTQTHFFMLMFGMSHQLRDFTLQAIEVAHFFVIYNIQQHSLYLYGFWEAQRSSLVVYTTTLYTLKNELITEMNETSEELHQTHLYKIIRPDRANNLICRKTKRIHLLFSGFIQSAIYHTKMIP